MFVYFPSLARQHTSVWIMDSPTCISKTTKSTSKYRIDHLARELNKNVEGKTMSSGHVPKIQILVHNDKPKKQKIDQYRKTHSRYPLGAHRVKPPLLCNNSQTTGELSIVSRKNTMYHVRKQKYKVINNCIVRGPQELDHNQEMQGHINVPTLTGTSRHLGNR
ncbi:hypothetical protein H5410_041579 [Solanum commersonii]|uniref:Uncharacterized protein n=1 Tax=Solanum commersonii TaxID=4109 RepID=A0A9J5XS99_SOLCO|nr:hypothetical protein H5410_041579 [Solanum commersonii]